MRLWRYAIEEKVFNVLVDDIVDYAVRRSSETRLLNLAVSISRNVYAGD